MALADKDKPILNLQYPYFVFQYLKMRLSELMQIMLLMILYILSYLPNMWEFLSPAKVTKQSIQTRFFIRLLDIKK